MCSIRSTLKPDEAAAFYVMGILQSWDLPALATNWLEAGSDSQSVRVLAGESDPIMSEVGPLFESALTELEVPIPDRPQAAQRVLRYYLHLIATGSIDPVDGMIEIDNNVVNAVRDLFPNEKYVGDGLGLENLYMWYREVQDAADGSRLNFFAGVPTEEATRRCRQLLVEAAKERLKRLV